MAIDFPPNNANPDAPQDGDTYVDAASGTEWTYDATNNSWTLSGSGSAGGGAFTYIGEHDFTQATLPVPAAEAGYVYTQSDIGNVVGTVDAAYTGIAGDSIEEGDLVLYTGSSWTFLTNVPGYPNLGDGDGDTLDTRYVKLAGNDSDVQTITGKAGLQTDGMLDSNGGIKIEGGAADEVLTGLARKKTSTDQNGSLHLCTASESIIDVARALVQVTTTRTNSGGAVLRANSTHSTTSDSVSANTYIYDATPSFNSFNNNFGNLTIYNAGQVSHTDTTFSELRSFSTDARNSGFATLNYGFYGNLPDNNNQNFNFYGAGAAPNFLTGDTYIGGTTSRNTRELWESTLTEEQKEQLAAGTLTIPTNVSTPGDGSFARQWWYDQQSAEDQALIDSGELEYPERYQAANFVDTFDLGDDTNINLYSNGLGEFGGGVKISGGTQVGTVNGFMYDNTNKRFITVEGGQRVAAIKEGKFVFGGQTPIDGTLIALRGSLPVSEGSAGNRLSTFIRCEASFPVANDSVTGVLVRTGPEENGYSGTFTGIRSFADNANSPQTRWANCTEFKAFESAEVFGYAQKNYAFYSNLGTGGTNVNFNFYAAGAASNWFAGPVTGGGTDGANAAWSIAANGTATGITVTRASVVTDEQAGTVETLLDIITDLRARVATLEAGNGGY